VNVVDNITNMKLNCCVISWWYNKISSHKIIMLPFQLQTSCKICDKNISHLYTYNVGQDSSVSMVTRYGLDGPGIESRFSAPV